MMNHNIFTPKKVNKLRMCSKLIPKHVEIQGIRGPDSRHVILSFYDAYWAFGPKSILKW